MTARLDLLLVTHRHASYADQALAALATQKAHLRLWVWQNGTDAATVETVRRWADRGVIDELVLSPENVGLRRPTNWLWTSATGDLVGKVDDDIIVSDGWARRMVDFADRNPTVGIAGAWVFQPEDFDPKVAAPKLEELPSGDRLLRNCWVGGGGYVMRRRCVVEGGRLRRRQSWTNYCVERAADGWLVGWPYPFVRQEHLDDPRSPMTRIHSEADLAERNPLSLGRLGGTGLRDWDAQIRRAARSAQTASLDPMRYLGRRARLRRMLSPQRSNARTG